MEFKKNLERVSSALLRLSIHFQILVFPLKIKITKVPELKKKKKKSKEYYKLLLELKTVAPARVKLLP